MKKIILFIAFVVIALEAFSQYTEVWIKQGLVFGDSQNNNIWSQGSIVMSEIIEFNGGYRMYYTILSPDSSQIQFADSPDGINWTYSGIAIKSDTSKNSLNRMWLVGAPSIIKLGTDSFRLYYSSSEYFTGVPKFCIKSAFSTDGTNFTDEGIRIEIYPHDSLSPVQLAGHGTFFVNDSGSVTGIFSADPVGATDPSNLFITTSPDGLNFSNFIDKYENWHDPIVIKNNGQYILYATYLNFKKGKAVSNNGINWPNQLDSISFQDSIGNVLTVASEGIGDLGGILMPNNETWLYTNYGQPSRNFALFKLSNPQSIINNNYTSKFKIYPNPAHNQIVVVAEELNIENIEILDITGKTIKRLSVNSEQLTIDVSDLSNGMFFIKINQTQTVKFIKE